MSARNEAIYSRLNNLLVRGFVSDYSCYAPDGKRRWLVIWQDQMGQRAGERAYSTSDIEMVLHAVETVTNDYGRR